LELFSGKFTREDTLIKTLLITTITPVTLWRRSSMEKDLSIHRHVPLLIPSWRDTAGIETETLVQRLKA